MDTIIDLPIMPDIRKCYGWSKNDTTRLSFPHVTENDPIISMISLKMSVITREEATNVFTEIIQSNPHIFIKYWKKQDRLLYYLTPPDGACGYYALVQAHQRITHGNTINLNTYSGRQIAADILSNIAKDNTLSSADGIVNMQYAIDWIRRKTQIPTEFLVEHYQLTGEDYYAFSKHIENSLFGQPAFHSRVYSLCMPDDIHHSEWLSLFSTSSNLIGETSFSMKDIYKISSNTQFVQLAGSHFWLFPILQSETQNCKEAFDILAISIWDTLHYIETPKIIYPTNNQITSFQNNKENIQIQYPKLLSQNKKNDPTKQNITAGIFIIYLFILYTYLLVLHNIIDIIKYILF